MHREWLALAGAGLAGLALGALTGRGPSDGEARPMSELVSSSAPDGEPAAEPAAEHGTVL